MLSSYLVASFFLRSASSTHTEWMHSSPAVAGEESQELEIRAQAGGMAAGCLEHLMMCQKLPVAPIGVLENIIITSGQSAYAVPQTTSRR